MTDEEYHEKMHRTNHSNTCSWGWDQYWWECDCGAISVDELRAEQQRRARECDDLQLWIRHGRIGRGHGYQAEVDRAKKIEAEGASTVPFAQSKSE